MPIRQCPPISKPVATARNYRVTAAAYYLRPWSTIAPGKANPVGDNIPTLMRATLSDCGVKACVRHEALIEGIANLQIQYAIDQDSGVLKYVNADELGDIATTTVGKAQWQRVGAVRNGVLARSFIPEPDYVDGNAPYHLGDQAIDVAVGYRHYWLTSTVALRKHERLDMTAVAQRHLHRSPAGCRGAVLAVALLFLVILTMLGITVMSVSQQELKMAGQYQRQARIREQAEACLKIAEADAATLVDTQLNGIAASLRGQSRPHRYRRWCGGSGCQRYGILERPDEGPAVCRRRRIRYRISGGA